MADARKLREITDALRALIDRADAAGSAKARAILIMTTTALHDIAVEAEGKSVISHRGSSRR